VVLKVGIPHRDKLNVSTFAGGAASASIGAPLLRPTISSQSHDHRELIRYCEPPTESHHMVDAADQNKWKNQWILYMT
jgi:hypothetical protein